MVVEKRPPETQEQRAKRKRDRELNDIRVVLAGPEGRRFMWRVLSEGKIFVDGYVHGDGGFGTTYSTGRRSIGVWALSEVMEAKAESFMQMQREHASEAKREEMEDKDLENAKDILKPDIPIQPTG